MIEHSCSHIKWIARSHAVAWLNHRDYSSFPWPLHFLVPHEYHNPTFFYLTSGNHTPGSRFYSDLWIPPFASTSSCSKEPGCLYNFMRLAYGSFQLTHMSRHDHAVQLIELWRPKRRQYITTALTKFPKGWVSACKHQCTTAITTMWTESLWAFSESYTANDSWIVHSSNGDQRKTKALRTPQRRWVSALLFK